MALLNTQENTSCPFEFTEIKCDDLVIDYEYKIINIDLLASYVGEIHLGYYYHITKIIKGLSKLNSNPTNNSLQKVIEYINNELSIDKRNGLFFQTISWLALYYLNNNNKYYTKSPHVRGAQHGIDGLSVILTEDNKLDRIIITEDKFNKNPRNVIQQKVFPEFKKFEEGENDDLLVSEVSSLIENLDNGAILENNQNDIYKNDFRVYRIGVTRLNNHSSTEERSKLFSGYNTVVAGDITKRIAATTYLEQDTDNSMHEWMNNFTTKVVAYLESKKNQHV